MKKIKWISILVGIVVLLKATVPQGMIGMYDGSPPAGWQTVTTFNTRFPYGTSGSPPPETIGGDSIHTHTVDSIGVVGEIGGPVYGANGTDVQILRIPHDHTININVSSDKHLPLYRTTVFISATSELSTVPTGLILMFENTPPAGWTVINDFDQRFPRGNSNSPGITAGSSSHRHIIGSLGLPTNYYVENLLSGLIGGSTVTHDHDTIFSITAGNLPPYVDLFFASAPSGLSDIPVGAIAMFDAPPSGTNIGIWELYTPLIGRFPRGTTGLPSGTGGSSSHNHNGVGMALPSTGGSANFQSSTNPLDPEMSLNGHVHAVQISTDEVSLFPPYRVVYFYIKTALAGEHEESLPKTKKNKAEIVFPKVVSYNSFVFKNGVRINFDSESINPLKIVLYDLSGKSVFTKSYPFTPSSLTIGGEKMAKIGSGIYFLQMYLGKRKIWNMKLTKIK